MIHDRKFSIIVGSLLGDGCIEKSRRNCPFVINMCIESKEHLDWISQELLPFPSVVNVHDSYWGIKIESGKAVRIRLASPHQYAKLRTKSLPEITRLEEKWYLRDDNGFHIFKQVGKRRHRIKIVPSDLVLDPLMVAVWYVQV
jgi:hypothetical protein